MTSHARNKRRLIQWRRYELRHHITRIHRGYARAFEKASFQGRYAPIGIRSTDWIFRVPDKRQYVIRGRFVMSKPKCCGGGLLGERHEPWCYS